MLSNLDARKLKRPALLVGGCAAACMAILWSWNTIVQELLSGPRIQFRHALALLVAMLLLRWLLTESRRGRR